MSTTVTVDTTEIEPVSRYLAGEERVASMDGRQGSKERLERPRGLGTGVWLWYLTTGAALAVARMALLVWINHRAANHRQTEMDYYLTGLYPEAIVSFFWNSLLAFSGTKYYLAWGSLVTVGSFLLATPILLVGWRRQRRTTSQPSR